MNSLSPNRFSSRKQSSVSILCGFAALLWVLVSPATLFAQNDLLLKQENELRAQVKKLEAKGQFDAAIESQKKAMELRRRRLKNQKGRPLDDPADTFLLTQLRNKKLNAPKTPSQSASPKEVELRELAQELESKGLFKPAIEALTDAIKLRRKRLEYKVPDLQEDTFWLVQLRNKDIFARNPELDYFDKWYDRRQEFHDGGKLAEEIAQAQNSLKEITRRRGENHPEVVAAREQVEKMQADRAAKLENLKKNIRYRDQLIADGKQEEASVYFRRCLRLRREIYGDDDLAVGIAALEAANAEVAIGKTYGFCEQLLTLAEDVFTRIYGEKHWRVIDTRVTREELQRLRLTLPRVQKRYAVLRAHGIQCEQLLEEGDFFRVLEITREDLAFLQMFATTTPLTVRAIALSNQAAAYRSLGRFQLSLPVQREAIEQLTTLFGPNHPMTVSALNSQYVAYRNLADHLQALSIARRAIAVCEKVWGTEHIEYAVSLTNLAVAMMDTGTTAEVRPLLVRALKIAETDFNRYAAEWTTSFYHLANLEYRIGRFEEAKRLYEGALKNRRIAPGPRHPDSLETLSRLAAVNRTLGNLDEAEQQYREYLETVKTVLWETHPDHALQRAGLALVLRDQGKMLEAESELDAALQAMRNSLDSAFEVLSERQQLAITRDGYRMLSDYTALASEIELPPEKLYAHVLSWKGAVLDRQRRARSIPADAESAELLRKLQETSRKLASLSLAKPEPGTQEKIQEMIGELSQQKEKLESELAERGAKTGRDTEEPIDLARIQAVLPEDTVLVDFHIYREFPSKKNRDAEGSGRHLLAFVVRSEEPLIRVDLGLLEPIKEAGEAWRRAIVGGGGGVNRGLRLLKDDSKPEAMPQHKLRRLLWEPIEDHLSPNVTVLISTDGEISRLPFAALPGRDRRKYLIEEHPIALVPVVKQLPTLLDRVPAEQSSSEMSLALFGNVDFGASPGRPESVADDSDETRLASNSRAAVLFGDAEFADLPGTESEITAIAELYRKQFKSSALESISGAEATEDRFRQTVPHFRYLHMATHGFFASQPANRTTNALTGQFEMHPGLRSGIVLAGANHRQEISETTDLWDDGVLTSLEVSALPLTRVELAVLSACETGLGKTTSGEGLLSLQRSFLSAGATSTLTSLWKVDDFATQALMIEFYRNLWDRKLMKLEALREAQLAMLKHYDPQSKQLDARGLKLIKPNESKDTPQAALAPFYWAAFQLSGDWR